MNREIKFRIWAREIQSDLTKEEMVYLPSSVIYDGRDLVFRTDLETFWIDSSSDGKGEIMQFTGIIDTEGKEIYEGDIVTQGELTGEVCVWVENASWVVAYNPPSFCMHLCQGKWKIIGNVFETPDLCVGKN